MNKVKIAITLDYQILQRLDSLIKNRTFPNRSRAIQEAVEEKIERIEHTRLARECAKCQPDPVGGATNSPPGYAVRHLDCSQSEWCHPVPQAGRFWWQ